MVTKRCKKLPTMLAIFLVSLISMLSFSHANTEGSVSLSLSNDVLLSEERNLETYIVFVKKPEGRVTLQSMDLHSWYQSFLPVTISSLNQQQRIVHSYRNVATGFACKLTAEEAKAMEEKEGIVSVRRERKLRLHTTQSPSFLGLHQNLGFWKHSNFGKGVIIGVLDTGVRPDHPSFNDEGMPPPPAKWRGICEFNGTACNNKLIGARNFVTTSTEPPFDDEGHGTHTASTAAGNFVKDANVFGNANGTAVGIAPLAHLAIYKVCGAVFCRDSDILAAMDAAVDDGVDILSLSLGGGSEAFYDDSIAVGAFGAIQKGILVSCSAGNDGPKFGSLSNEAPWILTVGASTIDRTIMATAKLGNGEELFGESLHQPKDFPSTLLPLVYPGANGSIYSDFCMEGSLKNVDVKGKVVLCEIGGIGNTDKGQVVKDAGGAAMILMNDVLNGYSTFAEAHVLPATHVSYAAGVSIKAYIDSTSTPTATILFEGTVIGNPWAPEVTFFSSRGPSLASPGILKPDIIGPGVNILAAWPVSVENNTNTNSTFNIISGTSMSCPHLSGVAALLKSAHPDWSPAAIKSAIMTSADLVNLGGKPIVDQTHLPADIFAIGAGHVNPSSANDPGLLYDIQPDDYIPYLCGLNYTDKEVGIIVQRTISCSNVKSIPEAQLNYPAFSIKLGASPQTYTRNITNIGDINYLYNQEIIEPQGVDVDVWPDEIGFRGVNLTQTYTVTFSRKGNISEQFAHGYIKWVSVHHSIRIPIAVTFG